MSADDSVRELIKRALKEDVGTGDITANTIVSKEAKANAIFYAHNNGVVAGLDIVKEVFSLLDKKIKFKKFVQDGTRIKINQPLAEINGRVRVLLTGERVALNFLQHLSGVATLTRKYVDEVKPYKAKILDTRKTTPCMRILEKYAVKMGGGTNHRMGLYEMAMVKDNHIKYSSRFKVQSSKFLKNIIRKLRKKIPKGMKIEVEAKNLKEVEAALESGADIIMLDNMNVPMMKKAVNLIKHHTFITPHKRPIIEASGNVTLKNVRTIAKTGVDWISVGRLTHSSPALDISMEIE